MGNENLSKYPYCNGNLRVDTYDLASKGVRYHVVCIQCYMAGPLCSTKSNAWRMWRGTICEQITGERSPF